LQLKPDVTLAEGQRQIMQRLVANYNAELAALEEYSHQVATQLGINLSEYSFDIVRMRFIDKESLKGGG
jgi:hypothetical protein